MLLGRVIGSVVASVQHASFHGKKLLVVATGNTEVVAVDGVGAGVGEQVLVVLEGTSAALAAGVSAAPLDAAIIAIVDSSGA